MKNYIAFTSAGFLSVQSNNKTEAYEFIKSKCYSVNKKQVLISSVHMDYVTCKKIS